MDGRPGYASAAGDAGGPGRAHLFVADPERLTIEHRWRSALSRVARSSE
jgi:hypothetical protein